ncbi:unnamed protein product [Cladocopium goreaui]|uniref:Uncharacterized protein n=1 Tax=Cladocopium goreaui TaxID=2562237 RepID=A0A9P1G9T2_9DINO|nr:unnamed protein product [Cladocopium goreaui]
MKNAERDLHNAVSKAKDVRLKVHVTYVSVPVIDKKYWPRPKPKKTPSRIWGKRGRPKAQAKRKPTKKDTEPRRTCWVQWPVLSPAKLFQAIVESGSMSLLHHPDFDWCDFWERASVEDWGREHPVVKQFDVEARARAIAATFHGDEGEGKRGRNTLILSWSSIGVHGPSSLTKFPFCAYTDFCKSFEEQEFLITNVFGSFKWHVKKVVGHHMIAHHCSLKFPALVLKPIQQYKLLATVVHRPPNWSVEFTNPCGDPGDVLAIVFGVEPKTWAETLAEGKGQIVRRGLITEQDAGVVQFMAQHADEMFPCRIVNNQLVCHSSAGGSKRRRKA